MNITSAFSKLRAKAIYYYLSTLDYLSVIGERNGSLGGRIT